MSTSSKLTISSGFGLGVYSAGSGGDGTPLLVLLPGGTYTAGYFDVPGHSLLDAAAARGFRAVAIDRPNYGASDPLPYEQTTFAENARILSEAIGVLWEQAAPGTPGAVILGHSIGGSIAVHIAAAHYLSWPLLGLSLSGVNEKSPDHVVAAWESVPAGVPVDLPVEQRRMFMYGPDGSFDPAVLEAAVFCSPPGADAGTAGDRAGLDHRFPLVGAVGRGARALHAGRAGRLVADRTGPGGRLRREIHSRRSSRADSSPVPDTTSIIISPGPPSTRINWTSSSGVRDRPTRPLAARKTSTTPSEAASPAHPAASSAERILSCSFNASTSSAVARPGCSPRSCSAGTARSPR